MRTLKEKFTSRKFLMAFFGIIAGAVCITMGNTTEGVTTIISSVAAYLIAEGYIDAKSVQSVAQGVADSVNKENGGTEND